MLANVGAKYKGGKRPCFDSMSNEYLTCYCDIKIFSFFFIHNVVTSLFCCCCFGMEVPFAFELSQQEPQTHEIRHSTSTNSRHSDSSTSPFKKKKKDKKAIWQECRGWGSQSHVCKNNASSSEHRETQMEIHPKRIISINQTYTHTHTHTHSIPYPRRPFSSFWICMSTFGCITFI